MEQKLSDIPQLDRERIRDIIEVLRTNVMMKRYLEKGNKVCEFPIDVNALEDVLAFTLEILYKHLPDAINRINALEGTYQSWYHKLQHYDELAKEVAQSENYPEKIGQLLTHLGYKGIKNDG